MLKTSLISFTAATVLAASSHLHAGALPRSTNPPAPQASGQAATQPTMVHFEGCLFTEPALTATTPIVVPAGTTQKWVLTNVKVIAGAINDDEAAKTTYGLNKVDGEQARSFYGKRVGVTGRVSPATPRPTLEVVDLREISGGCPMLPSLQRP